MPLSAHRLRHLTRIFLGLLALLAAAFLATLRLGDYHPADLLRLLAELV